MTILFNTDPFIWEIKSTHGSILYTFKKSFVCVKEKKGVLPWKKCLTESEIQSGSEKERQHVLRGKSHKTFICSISSEAAEGHLQDSQNVGPDRWYLYPGAFTLLWQPRMLGCQKWSEAAGGFKMSPILCSPTSQTVFWFVECNKILPMEKHRHILIYLPAEFLGRNSVII